MFDGSSQLSEMDFETACARLGLDRAHPDLKAELQGAFQRALKEAREGDVALPAAHYRELLQAYRTLRDYCPPTDPAERRFEDWPTHIELTPEEAILGGMKTGRLLTGRPFTTKLPPGLRDGDLVWVWGWLIQVKIDGGEDLAVRGDDVWVTSRKSVSALKAGARVTVDTPMGPWSFRLSEEAIERKLVRVPGAGLPAARHHKPGDLYVRFEAEPDRGPAAMIGKMFGKRAA
jgi:curved DNA-binding protein